MVKSPIHPKQPRFHYSHGTETLRFANLPQLSEATPAAGDDAFVFANSPCSFVGRDSPGKQQVFWRRKCLVPATLSND